MQLLTNMVIGGASLSGVVIKVAWKLTGVDTTSIPASALSGSFMGTTPFDPTTISLSAFTNYSDLTKDTVIGWVEDYVNNNYMYQSHIYEAIQDQIDLQMTSLSTVEYVFPWGSTGTHYSPPSGA